MWNSSIYVDRNKTYAVILRKEGPGSQLRALTKAHRAQEHEGLRENLRTGINASGSVGRGASCRGTAPVVIQTRCAPKERMALCTEPGQRLLQT